MNQLRSRLKWRFYFAKARVGLHFRRTMVEGVLLSVPIVITFLVLRWVWGLVDGVLRPTIESSAGISFPGLGVVALLVLIYLVGLTWEIDLGKRILGSAQRILMSLPIVSTIYAPARQLIQSFSGSGPSGFKRVVVIEYPRAGTWMLGFLTSITTGKDGIRMGVVYVPTAPTPSSGWVAILPLDEVFDTEMSVKEAMTMVLSGGIATPDEIEMAAFDERRRAAALDQDAPALRLQHQVVEEARRHQNGRGTRTTRSDSLGRPASLGVRPDVESQHVKD